MRIKEGSSRPGEGFMINSLIMLRTYFIHLFACPWNKNLFIDALLIVWSEDDWLKKFSGKTIEESEEAESAAESASTNTQEVGML